MRNSLQNCVEPRCAAELCGSAVAAGLWRLLRQEASGDTGADGGAGRRWAAEGLGTFILVTAVGLNIVSASHATAYSAAALLMALLEALGGHFNPAVTLAVLLRRKIEKKEALKYLLAQLGHEKSVIQSEIHLTHRPFQPISAPARPARSWLSCPKASRRCFAGRRGLRRLPHGLQGGGEVHQVDAGPGLQPLPGLRIA